MKKTLSILLTLILVFSFSIIPAQAAIIEENVASPYYAYTGNVISRISISSKTSTSTSIVSGLPGITTKIVITQRLQKKNGDSWNNVQSWTKTFNQVSATYTNTKSSLTSGTYRTRTIAKVYKGTAYETIKVNSTTVTI